MAEGREKKKNLFEREVGILNESKKVLDKEITSIEELKEALKHLQDNYEDLVDQSKLITKVSDRLQKKINRANEDLEIKNTQLTETIDALTAARVGRRATTITLIIFVVLFLVAEGLVEPNIEDYVHDLVHDDSAITEKNGLEITIGLGLKGILAIMLRPVEKIVEKQLMRRERKKKEAELKLKAESGSW